MSIPRWLSGKESACNAGAMSFPLQQEEPLEKEMVTHSSSLAWEIHGQRRLAGFSPWGCTELGHTWVAAAAAAAASLQSYPTL